MTPEQKAAYVTSQAACAIAEVAGMQAENQARAFGGYPPLYMRQDFTDVINRNLIDHNHVVAFFRDHYMKEFEEPRKT